MNFALFLSLLLIFLLGLILPYDSKQKNAKAITDLSGDSSVTITSTNNTATVTISPTTTGTFATTSGSGDIAFSVSTDNYTGYTLTARSSYTTLDNNNDSFQSLTSSVTAEQFSSASNTALNNHWGYKPNYYNSEENTKYYGASTTAVTLDTTSTANNTAKNYTISLGARANNAIPSGNYINNSIILEAVANVVPFSFLTINYGDGVTSVTIGSSTIADGETVKLIQGVPYDINMTYDSTFYAFDSWTATSGMIGSSSTQSTTYTINSSNATLTANVTFIGPDIQNLDGAGCTSTASLARDNRDGHMYTIQRLLDGNCWMMENLDLGRTDLSVDLTSANTNLATTVSASTFNSWRKTTGTATYETGEFIPIDGIDSTSGTAYGTLYNFYASSAGTIFGSTNSSDSLYDVCPAGWRLPTGGDSGEFQALYTRYSTNALLRAPITEGGVAFALAGNFYGSTPANQSIFGRYRSSTWRSETAMYNFDVGTSNVDASHYGNRNYGNSIRCILKNTSHKLTVSYDTGVKDVKINGVSVANNGTIDLEEGLSYDISAFLISGHSFTNWLATSGTVSSPSTQSTTYTIGITDATLTATSSFNGPIIQNLPTTDCTTTASYAKDIRDGHVYAIQRLADGNCWMMENLDLGRTDLTTDLTSENTNLSNTVAASTFNSWKKTTGTETFSAGEFIPIDASNSIDGLAVDTVSGTAYGTLYNYYAASAGTITGDTNSSDALYDICPAGWRLPTGGDTGEFSALYAQYNSYALMRAPIAEGGAAFALSGASYNPSIDGQGRSGRYWASNWSGTDDDEPFPYEKMYQLHLNSQTVYPSASYYRNIGSAIRCVLKELKTISMLEYLQNFKYLSAEDYASVLASMEDNTTYNLIDNRDNKTYAIAKMKDGEIWMAENLDLGRTTLMTDLTSYNTNLSSTVTASTFNSWRSTTGTSTFDAGVFISISGTDSTSGTPYGTLYNYYAATAGTISGSSNTSDASYDICPAGWRLPNHRSGEFSALYNLYNSYALMRAPIENNGAAFALAGVFDSEDPKGQDSYAYYWSSSWSNSDSGRWTFGLDASKVTLTVGTSRNMGHPIRCIAAKTISQLTYLQDFKGLSAGQKVSVSSSMEDSTIYNLIDNRDDRSYAIAKMKDGKIWMAENLDLGRTVLTKDLTSANTNLYTTVTASTFNSWSKATGTATYDAGEFISVSGTDATSGTPYGTLYNYYAASAGTISGSSNTRNATYDICPAGWRLPTGGSSGEFSALYSQYNSYALMRAPIEDNGAAFALAGNFYRLAPENQEAVGQYLSSTRYNDKIMYGLYLNTSGVNGQYTFNRYYGNAVRCIVK